ncbi:translation initiation factor eIF-2B [Methylophaga sp.]|uniref:translation initiation factor eIF-2B n=1 Tax=Methylophaga sp. TaxID=2024840 RepID=UPI003F69F964
MSESFEQLLTSLKNNHQSGATELALITLASLKAYMEALPLQSLDQLTEIVDELSHARPSMIVLANALHRWLHRQELKEALSKQGYLDSLSQIYQQLSDASDHVAEHAASLVKPGMTILTHSRSSQVSALFEHLLEQHVDIKIVVTVSEPGKEGLLVASQLSRLGIPVTVITDAEMGLTMPDIDLNISGCDSWLSDHHFVNKTGTFLQALAAHHYGKPFWVLADSFKTFPQTSHNVILESMPTDELQLPKGKNISGRNTYFETIPTRLITGRINENGLEVMQL